MKALAILRVSTEGQRIDDQKEELIAFLRSQGYDEIIPLEAVGASAIKMDDKYLELVDKVKTAIVEDKDIKAAGVWELSRLGRNEIILFQFKEFFIQHQIQFICKQPYMRLLEEDGSVNAGMELAFSLYATMSKQEMAEKKARFKRRKKAMAQKGEYSGGHIVPFGYKVENGVFMEDKKDGCVVRLCFDLYSTGSYSASSLANELSQRGYPVTERKVSRILQYTGYTGEGVGDMDTHFPQIISRELFDTCADIRQKNKLNLRQGSRVVLGSKLVRCYKCGAVCTSNSRHYICCRATHKLGCENRYALRKDVVDDLLWRTAFICHMDYLLDLDGKKKKEYKKELKVVKEKLKEVSRKIADFGLKKDRIIESYLDGLIDKKNRDLRLLKLSYEVRDHTDRESVLKARKIALERMLEDHGEDAVSEVMDAVQIMDSENKFKVIHQHIEKITGVPESFGIRDKRCSRPNSVLFTVTSVYGQDYLYRYFPRYYKGHNLYVFNGHNWTADYVTPVQHTSK